MKFISQVAHISMCPDTLEEARTMITELYERVTRSDQGRRAWISHYQRMEAKFHAVRHENNTLRAKLRKAGNATGPGASPTKIYRDQSNETPRLPD